MPEPSPSTADPPKPAADRRRGINVVGHLTGAFGLGNTARIFIAALRSAGVPVAGFDIAPWLAQEEPGLDGDALVATIAELPHDVNLFVVAADQLPHLWLRHGAFFEPRFRNVGMFFWELPVVPRAWVPALRLFDAIVTCSHYVRQAVEHAVPEIPTVFAEHPIEPFVETASPIDVRRRFGIPTDATAFLVTYDTRSGHMRKNPLGAIRAWRAAFPSDPGVCLVIKTHGGEGGPRGRAALMEGIAGDPRIVEVAERLERHEVLHLLHACDVILSLHRSEGLGLVPLEAMALGRPVIATGYSGNLTFMTQQNSMLVGYRLVRPDEDRADLSQDFAGRGAFWAEPDLDAASDWMRRCHREPGWRERLGAHARADMAARQETAWSVPFVDEVHRLADASMRVNARAQLRRRVALAELTDPTLRRRNLASALRRLRDRRPGR